jgi:hypothetical protein
VPNPVAARSKEWVCCHSLDGIAGSNKAGCCDVCLSIVCCQDEVSAPGRPLVCKSPTERDVSEYDREPRYSAGPDPVGNVGQWGE